jgi:H+/Cl- antiporter ClcA
VLPAGAVPKPVLTSATPSRKSWLLVAYAAALGVFGAVVGLLALGTISLGSAWGADSDPGWLGGHWWWVGVTTTAGVVVGLLRWWTRLPESVPGLFEDLRGRSFDTRLVPGIVAVSAVSLVGGASVGPEKVLAAVGAGAGRWMSQWRGLDEGDANVNAFAGIAGIFGGLFSSPVIVVMMILEIARPGGNRFSKILVTGIVAGSVSFGIYFAVAGAVFLGSYQVPPYRFENWHLLAGVLLGLLGALVSTLVAGLTTLASRLFDWLRLPDAASSTLGGAFFGIVAVVLPLTMFSGGDQLGVVLTDSRALGLGLCVPTLLAKMVTYAVSQASGFVGGPIFPTLFIGGTAGVVVHQAIPSVPLGLAFCCLLPAVLGSLAAAPISMVLLAALVTRVGPLETSPILIAVVSAYLGVEGVKRLAASLGWTGGRPARTRADAESMRGAGPARTPGARTGF